MKIYFAMPVIGNECGRSPCALFATFLQERGHQILTEHLSRPETRNRDGALPREAIYRRDMDWLERADALVAEVSAPSTGVGYEIAVALGRRKPVFCLAREGVPVSAMVEGNPALTLMRYRDPEEALSRLEEWLRALLFSAPLD